MMSMSGRGIGRTRENALVAAGVTGIAITAFSISRDIAGDDKAKLAATRNNETEPSPLQHFLRAIEKALVSMNITFMIAELTHDRNVMDSV